MLIGNSGNDTLTGDASDNWLAGGSGSDVLSGGGGNDFLVIDSQDIQANLSGGTGFDVVQVVGRLGVNINLAAVQVEGVVGGAGDDVFIAGGNSNSFIRGGDGEDFIAGGSADDALSGEAGNDTIDGGYGDDVIRGHEGRDVLIGNQGEDYLSGGDDADWLYGKQGDDLLRGEAGNDTIYGGGGHDVVEFRGNVEDYIIAINGSVITVSDKRADRDGADTLYEVEGFNFANLTNIGLSYQNSIITNDVVTLNGTATRLITAQSLLGNDTDFQGNALRITAIGNVSGGSATLNPDGSVSFTPDAAYKGVRSFTYRVKDSNNFAAASIFDPASGQMEEMKATVYLHEASHPTDPLFYDQWYLSDVNVLPVWQDYTGKGVSVGVFETGIPELTNSEFVGRVDSDLLSGGDVTDHYTTHATQVAGVIGADRNNASIVGIAYDAVIGGSIIPNTTKVQEFYRYDIVNNSWGTAPFSVNSTERNTLEGIYSQSANYGRNGLGTVIVFSGGNDRERGFDVGDDAFTANRFTIAVGGVNKAAEIGQLDRIYAPFSTEGAAILVSAPASNMPAETMRITNDNGSVFQEDGAEVQGTSFAAPIVSGVIALMLEANPLLGYRDVQNILAYSARKIDDGISVWQENGAENFNGGGLHYSRQYGNGMVDAYAAVRMAETWTSVNILNNQLLAERNSGIINLSLPDQQSVTRTFTVTDTLEVEQVELVLDVNHQRLGDLVVTLTSPDGTSSTLLNRHGVSTTTLSGTGSMNDTLTLLSQHFRGELAQGVWTVTISDARSGSVGTLESLGLKLYGKPDSANDTYFFTDEYRYVTQTDHKTLSDALGTNTINSAAVSGNQTINLNAATNSTLAGNTLTLTASAKIHHVFTGDGADTITGSALANRIWSGRGDDSINAGSGNDTIIGHDGSDTLRGGSGADIFVITPDAGARDSIYDFEIGVDSLQFAGFDSVSNFGNLTINQNGTRLDILLPSSQRVLLLNTTLASFTSTHVAFSAAFDLATPPENMGVYLGDEQANNIVWPAAPAGRTIHALGGNDSVWGGLGNDTIRGGNGNDQLVGTYQGSADSAGGQDLLYGESGNDSLGGAGENDTLYGGDGGDQLSGDSGDDVLYGEAGLDALYGGVGKDTLFGGDDNDYMAGNEDADSLSGGAGNDSLFGGYGQDSLLGEGGNDVIYSDESSDYADGGAGLDSIYGGIGDDSLYGGADADQLVGEDGNDLVSGDDGADSLWGGLGNDTLIGGNHNDGLLGNEGDDSLDGQAGDDSLWGYAGDDTLIGGTGNDSLVGAEGNDSLLGGSALDTLFGGEGNDYISGFTGNDQLIGNNGDDTLLGGSTNDSLYGDAGADLLRGEGGAYILWGGAGNDVFLYLQNNESASSGRDVIYDFIKGQDKINLANFTDVKDSSNPADDVQVYFTGIRAGAGSGTELGYSYDATKGNTVISTAAGDIYFFLELYGNIALSNSDFIF